MNEEKPDDRSVNSHDDNRFSRSLSTRSRGNKTMMMVGRDRGINYSIMQRFKAEPCP